MKKIVLIGMLGIVLAGCDNANVTKEKFLLGKWHCNEDIFEKKNSERNEDYGDISNKEEYTISYKMIDGKLNLISPNGDASPLANHFVSNEEFEEVAVKDGKYRFRENLTKINNNQFRSIFEMEYQGNANTTNLIDLRVKTMSTCTRIK